MFAPRKMKSGSKGKGFLCFCKKGGFMKKIFTLMLSLLLSLVLVFSFVACNTAKENEDENEGENGGTEDTSVANSLIIENAFGALLDAGALHITLEESSFDLGESMLLEVPGISGKMAGECYVRTTDEGYDLVAKLDIYMSMEDEDKLSQDAGENAGTVKEYVRNQFFSMEFYYVDSNIYTYQISFKQAVIDGAGYEDFQAYQDSPEAKDAHIYNDIVEDFSSVDETIGNIDTGSDDFTSRVEVEKTFRYANSLNVLIQKLTKEVPILEQLGLSSLEDYVSLLKRAGASVAKLDGGKTVAEADGSKTLSAAIDLNSLVNEVKVFIAENMENTIGTAIGNLVGKDEEFVADVIDKLFPAEGKDLTINQFIAAIEEILGELGVNFSVKGVIDEIQTITGLTTQQIADIINPLLSSLPGNISISINPQEGETLYDTLARTAFDECPPSCDSPTSTRNGSGSGSDTEGEAEPLTSAMVNQMLKMYLDSPDMTLALLLESMGLPVQVLNALEVESGDIGFNFAFDGDNKLTEFGADVDLGIFMAQEIPDASEAVTTEKMTVVEFEGTVKLKFEYSANDSEFAIPDDLKPVELESDAVLTEGETISLDALLEGQLSQDEIKKLEGLQDWDVDLLMVNKSDGSITVLERYNNEYVKVLPNNLYPSFQLIGVPEDCEYIYLIFGDDTIYSLKVQLSAAEEAPAA